MEYLCPPKDPKITFEEQIREYNKLELLNHDFPAERPKKDRESLVIAYKGLADNKPKESKTVISGRRHFSRKHIHELKPMNLGHMKVPGVHEGLYLTCRSVTDAILTEKPFGISVLVEDVNGEVEELELYSCSTMFQDTKWLKTGTIMLVKEPALMYTSNAKETGIQVYSPSDIVFVHETQKEILEHADALVWFKPESLTFDELKEQAANCFKQKDCEEALKLYERALAVRPDSGVIYLNMSATYLLLERFYEAHQAVGKALELGNIDRSKALYRLSKAAYGLRDWDESIAHLEALLKEFPNTALAAETLANAKARREEVRTGRFDLARLNLDHGFKRLSVIDAAEYVGPVEIVDVPGKGRGLIATKDVKKGTLLLTSKAFATYHMKNLGNCEVNGYNLLTENSVKGAQVGLIQEAMKKMKENPQIAKDVYALFAGDLDRNEVLPDGIIDPGRMEQICSFSEILMEVGEHDMATLEASSLWTMPSYLNHSCNTCYNIYGDVMLVNAMFDIKKGDLLTYNYVHNIKMYKERKALLQRWRIECDCRLCELDRNDPILEEREEIMTEYHANKFAWIALPDDEIIRKITFYLNRLRNTYNGRELPFLLYWPLHLLMMNCIDDKRWQPCIDAFMEIRAMGEHMTIRLDKELYLMALEACMHLNKRSMAKQLAKEFFEIYKARTGVNKSLFAKIHPQIHLFLE